MHRTPVSPVGEVSTPPSTPPSQEQNDLRPSLSRNSRPSSIHTPRHDWTQDIVLESLSPNNQTKTNNLNVNGHGAAKVTTVTDKRTPQTESRPKHDKVMLSPVSPYFVHSHLDKGASLAEWLRMNQPQFVAHTLPGDGSEDTKRSKSDAARHASSIEDENDDFGGSLTKQLVDTAIGVREASKQLGQC
jgi:NAD+ kinase